MGGIKLIGAICDCQILPREKGTEGTFAKIGTKSDRNGTKSSFMIHKEFMRNNSLTVTSNSFAEVRALSEFFGLVHSLRAFNSF